MTRHGTFRLPRPLAFALALLFCPVAGATRWTDFRQKSATNGWSLAGTSYSSDRGLKFAEAGAFAQRGDYGGAVTSVTVVTYCSGARLDDPFALAAGATAGGLVDREPPIAYVYTRYATNTFAFAEAEDVRVVRVRSTADGEVKGNYYLTALGVAYAGETPEAVPPPGGEAEPGEATPVDADGCWRVSEFADCRRGEDFAWALGVTKTTPWENGVTVPGFHAFRNGVAVTSAGRDSGRATAAGLYASRAADAERPRGLSLLGSGATAVALELRVLNDGREPLAGARVAFDACQWTFPESEARELAFDWAVTRTASRPPDDAWRTEAAAGCASRPGPAAEGEAFAVAPRTVSLSAARVPGCGVLWLRWSLPKKAGSPMLGVADVRVELVYRRGTALFIR